MPNESFNMNNNAVNYLIHGDLFSYKYEIPAAWFVIIRYESELTHNFERLKSGLPALVNGDGQQVLDYLYIDDCIEAVLKFMRQDSFSGPVNIGSEEMVTLNQLAQMAIRISNKNINIHNIAGEEFFQKYGFKCPTGVRGRNSDNSLYEEKMGWKVSSPLIEGMKKTYTWINSQVNG